MAYNAEQGQVKDKESSKQFESLQETIHDNEQLVARIRRLMRSDPVPHQHAH